MRALAQSRAEQEIEVIQILLLNTPVTQVSIPDTNDSK